MYEDNYIIGVDLKNYINLTDRFIINKDILTSILVLILDIKPPDRNASLIDLFLYFAVSVFNSKS